MAHRSQPAVIELILKLSSMRIVMVPENGVELFRVILKGRAQLFAAFLAVL